MLREAKRIIEEDARTRNSVKLFILDENQDIREALTLTSILRRVSNAHKYTDDQFCSLGDNYYGSLAADEGEF
jgi:hypothetical protein